MAHGQVNNSIQFNSLPLTIPTENIRSMHTQQFQLEP